MALSKNPNDTSNRAASAVRSLRYPLSEEPTLKTQMTFLKYSRLLPDDLTSMAPSAVVTLPLPMSVPDAVGIKVDAASLGAIGNLDVPDILKKINSTDNMGEAAITAMTEMAKAGTAQFSEMLKGNQMEAGAKMLHMLALAPGIADSNSPASMLLKRSIGVIQNPHTSAFFTGVELRTFNLSWNFSPRTREEAEALYQIKELIKRRVMPAESLNGYALDYPDIVEIKFLGDAAKYLGKIRRSYITSFNAIPKGGATMSFLEDGAPVELDFNMTLMETSIVTRDNLDRTDD